MFLLQYLLCPEVLHAVARLQTEMDIAFAIYMGSTHETKYLYLGTWLDNCIGMANVYSLRLTVGVCRRDYVTYTW